MSDRSGAEEGLELDDPLYRPARMRAFAIAGALLRSDLVLTAWRAGGLRRLGADLGAGTIVEGGVRITYPPRLRTGERVYLNVGCLLDSTGSIEIGDDVAVGPGTSVITTTHEPGSRERRAGRRTYRRVTIGRGVWLGAGVTVLPGVEIGAGSVVGAGSLVSSDLAADSLYVGSPARLVRSLA